jgi:hypothetical protein
MARELLNPKKFGSLANTKQKPWKAPLPEFIEQMVSDDSRKKKRRRARKQTATPSQQPCEDTLPPYKRRSSCCVRHAFLG